MARRRTVIKVADSPAEIQEEIIENQEILTWKVLHGGITLLNKKSYTKGQTFEAAEIEVPEVFRDSVTLLTAPKELPKREKMKYSLEEVVATAEEADLPDFVQLYNIVDGNGKVISEKPLEEENANSILKVLNQ